MVQVKVVRLNKTTIIKATRLSVHTQEGTNLPKKKSQMNPNLSFGHKQKSNQMSAFTLGYTGEEAVLPTLPHKLSHRYQDLKMRATE